ncbi:apolipoprotein N-acyltransferase [Caldichromatium japonicum]|uniref:Apolipoprotein N-acyltransferase n=1 Tax=Caldichromatium japonicum TaxID=2699430 RepID=A0A6G7VDJ9_9GAMM|nr:apolipoprotein N-acyltransferase [Caldichromatium japonicum]QIK38044.1 apolipoprotein N-acyltransferase [Caldichromatium japonicum]
MLPSLPAIFARLPLSVLALGAGGLAVLGFAPFGLFPLAVIACALFYQSLSDATPRTALWRGWLFGVGLFGFGTFWIRISLNEFGNMDAWVAHLLTALFVAFLALFYGAVGWLVRRLDQGHPSWTAPLLLLPGIWVLGEWVRSWLFTGFPWLSLGYSQIDGPLAGYAPILGVYGVSLLVALSGGLLWGMAAWRGRAPNFALIALAALWLCAAGLKASEWTHPSGRPLRASVLQANIPQAVKWDAEARLMIAEVYVDMTLEYLDADFIVWPETALPDFLHQVREPLIDPLAERAQREGTEIVLGIPVMDLESGRYFNGLLAIGSRESLYTKRHLVPFGEFTPLKSWLGPLAELFAVPMSDFSPGAGRPLLQVGPHRVGASICYEDAFPTELIESLPEAAYLINVSNDAWFGDSLAPHQHLEIARMRALETGRFLVRATNTGISAIIDHRGRLVAWLPLFVRGAITAEVQPREGLTPFARLGNAPAIGLGAALILLGIGLARWRYDPSPPLRT